MPSLLDKTLQRVQTKCFWSNFSKPRAHPQDRLELLSALLQFAGSPAAEPAEAGISLGAGTRRSGGPGPPLPNGAPPCPAGPPRSSRCAGAVAVLRPAANIYCGSTERMGKVEKKFNSFPLHRRYPFLEQFPKEKSFPR